MTITVLTIVIAVVVLALALFLFRAIRGVQEISNFVANVW